MNGYENHLEKGKEILRNLINNGCEAYIIGDAVCKTILQIPFSEVDITTNATPDVIKGIFSFTKVEDESPGAVRLYYSGYEFTVSTFRAAQFKDKRQPKRMHYSRSFHEELANRDFTANAIAMTFGVNLPMLTKVLKIFKGASSGLSARRESGFPRTRSACLSLSGWLASWDLESRKGRSRRCAPNRACF